LLLKNKKVAFQPPIALEEHPRTKLGSIVLYQKE